MCCSPVLSCPVQKTVTKFNTVTKLNLELGKTKQNKKTPPVSQWCPLLVKGGMYNIKFSWGKDSEMAGSEIVYRSMNSEMKTNSSQQWKSKNFKQNPGEPLLACLGLLSLHSYTTHYQEPRNGTTHSGLAPAPSITCQENTQQTCLQSDGYNFSVGIYFSQTCLGLLIKKSN